ncbi:MAG: hypothetical protein H6753_05700 [Candidatus Omnitrophica bacterium]|nr:hypothetical protein [Candidatus Omnitrophota bacterium]
MNFRKSVGVIIILCLIALNYCQLVSAEDPRYLAAYQSEYGLKLYHDGEVDSACERFVRALLLDPENTTAKDTLRKISNQITPQSHLKALRISRFIDQIEYFNFLDLRYRSLIEENKRLLEFASIHSEKEPSLIDKIRQIEKMQLDRIIALPSVSIVGYASDDEKIIDLDNMVLTLTKERQPLLREIGFWKGQNDQLRELRRLILNQVSRVTTDLASNNYKSQWDDIQVRLNQKDDLLTTQQQNIEYFQSELSSVRASFDQLQERFKNTDLKISELTKRIADMSMEVFEKDKLLAQKDKYANELQKEVNEANEKMNLVQRIIQEKDDRIVSLEKEMSRIQMMVNSGDSAANKEVTQFKTDFKEFEVQFNLQMEKSRDRIIGLEVQLADLSQKYQLLLTDVQAKNSQIVSLNRNLEQRNISAAQYREAFLTTNQEVNKLIGMVDIYRTKLVEAKQTLISKEAELNRLNQQKGKEDSMIHSSTESILQENYMGWLDLTSSRKIDR